MTFPYIIDDREIRQALADKTEIRFMEQSNGSTVCSYMVAGNDTFDSAFAREARGIVFDKNGKLISRTLHKFFNVNEREETLLQNIDWSKVTRVMDKRDGSMLHTVDAVDNIIPLNGISDFTLKSKKSYESDVAVQAREWMKTKEDFIDFCNYIVKQEQTAVFEWTAPTARIVIQYNEPGLTLLHVRDNLTGRYLDQDEITDLAFMFNIPLVKSCDDIKAMIKEDPKLLLEHAETLTNVEGWVIQFEDGNMVKLKTKWYLNLHRSMTFLRERDIAELVISEKVDDLKGLLVGEGACIDEIIKIEADVIKILTDLEADVTDKWEKNKHLDRKEIALMFGKESRYQHFGLLMHKYSGKEPDYKQYFERNMLKELFSLRQLNLVQSVAEVE